MKRSLIFLSTSFPRHNDDDAGIFVMRLVEALSALGESGVVIVPKDINQETLVDCGSFAIQRFRYGLFSRGRLAFGAGIVPNIRRSPQLILQAPLLLVAMTVAVWRQLNGNSLICSQWIVCGLVAWIVSLLRGTPYTVTVRGEDMRLLKIPIVGWLLRLSLRRARAVITVSQTFADQLKEITNINQNQITLIENGIAIPTAKRNQELVATLEERRPFLLFIGTIIPRKRLDILMEIVAQPVLANYSLVICGRLVDHQEVQQLSERSQQLKIYSRVFFEGAVSPEKIGDYIARAAAYVSTSEFEGRPNAALEALASGAIVALSDIPAHREIVEDGANGLLLDVEQIEESAQKLARCLNDNQQLEKMSLMARHRVAHLRWETAAAKYQELFF